EALPRCGLRLRHAAHSTQAPCLEPRNASEEVVRLAIALQRVGAPKRIQARRPLLLLLELPGLEQEPQALGLDAPELRFGVLLELHRAGQVAGLGLGHPLPAHPAQSAV